MHRLGPTNRRTLLGSMNRFASVVLLIPAWSLSVSALSSVTRANQAANLVTVLLPRLRLVKRNVSFLTLSTLPIEQVQLGDRVRADVPKNSGSDQAQQSGVLPVSEPSLDAEEVEPLTWRRVDLTMTNGEGPEVAIALLRPLRLTSVGAEPGRSIHMAMPEMGAVGPCGW